MSYRPMLIGRAPAQFNDLMRDPAAYEAMIKCILWLMDNPWDGLKLPDDHDPHARETVFGPHEEGLLRFRVDDDAAVLRIFYFVWVG